MSHKNVSKLFKRVDNEYMICTFQRDNGVKEAKKVYPDNRVIAYEPPSFIATRTL